MEQKLENLFGYFTMHRFFICLRGWGVMTLSSKVTEYRYFRACSYYGVQIFQGLFVLWNTDIAMLVHNTASSTVVLQNIDIAGLVHITEYCHILEI